jgi:[ribosomal protein S5]-alanine N-acetyltransferase
LTEPALSDGVVRLRRWRMEAGRAVRLASDWALSSFGVARLEAWVEPGNEASLRVLAAAGFRREGVLRAFLVLGSRRADAVVLSRLSGE